MTEEKTNQQIKLKDGRMLGYAEYGSSAGKPVFYFHGHPGTRLDWPLFDENDAGTDMNARIISIDRPGTGLSSFKTDREILDWPDDVIELAEMLQLDRFAVLGLSGGGPYAAACAFKIPKRLNATAIVCGMGPSEAPGAKEGASWIYAGKTPEERKQMLTGMAYLLRENPDELVSQMKEAPFPEPDKVLMDRPGFQRMLIDLAFVEALRPGIEGVDHEAALYARPWMFRLQDISTEVHLWHGEMDINVLVSVGRYVADAIPNCRAKFLPSEAHFSIAHNHIREILNILVS
ncbi:alpha/beta fold hydrolase [Chloroflexota bacterium]